MPWNNDGLGPRGYASGSSGGDGDKKRPASPWGNPGGGGGSGGGGDRPDPDRGPRKPGGPFGGGPFGGGGGPFGGGGGPFGGGGGPFGGGPGGKGYGPELDRLIAQAQGYIRGLMGGGSGGGRRSSPTSHFTGGRGLALLGMLVVLIWVCSGFYRVQPDEQGVVLRFGAYSYWTPPGLHWHLPWPIETALLPTVTRINRTEIGYRSGAAGRIEDGRDTGGRDVLAESLMLTGDENIIDIDVAVFWRVSNASAFLFNTASPEVLVRAVAESSLREVIGRTPIQPALTQARAQIETDMLKQVQEILDRYQAGVEVTQVQLQKVDPPAAVIESFRDVQRANTDAERMRNEADSYRNDIVPRARGDAARIIAEAQGAKLASVAQATGQTQRFDSVLKAYQAAKEVTLRRLYLDTMTDVLSHSQPLVVDDKLKGLVPFLPLNPPSAARPAAPPAPNVSTSSPPGLSAVPSPSTFASPPPGAPAVGADR
jgi:membrane protease subunit HflK